MSKKGIFGTRGDIFNSVQVGKVKRSGFDLSHDVKLSLDMGKLVPIMCEEVIPGDNINVNENILMRFAPLAAPVMQKIDVYTHAFKIPYRLMMRLGDFEAFITGGEDNLGKNEAGEVVTLPYFTLSQIHHLLKDITDEKEGAIWRELFSPGSLFDYFGFPVFPEHILKMTDIEIAQLMNTYDGLSYESFVEPLSIFPFRAYIMIYNEYFRDQRLIDKFDEYKDFGQVQYNELKQIIQICSPTARTYYKFRHDGLTSNMLLRAWKKDYFTSALPEAQLGQPVTLGIAGTAPVVASYDGDFTVTGRMVGSQKGIYLGQGDEAQVGNVVLGSDGLQVDGGSLSHVESILGSTAFDVIGSADLSKASAVTVEQLRVATAVQAWLEKIMRVGSRLREMYQGFFGVTPDDSSLQRPEFLGGGKTPVVVSETLQQSQSTDESVQGTPTGNAVSVGNFHAFRTFNKEYGLVMCIMSVIPSASYMQGVKRQLFGQRSKEDFPWPQFAHLGEQAVKNGEVYWDWDTDAKGVLSEEFGYQSRYAEYKYLPDRVHGDFRTSLDYWHLARKFSTAPKLNGEFVSVDPEECNRIFNVTADTVNNNHLWCEIWFDVKAVRCLPKYGTPSFGL